MIQAWISLRILMMFIKGLICELVHFKNHFGLELVHESIHPSNHKVLNWFLRILNLRVEIFLKFINNMNRFINWFVCIFKNSFDINQLVNQFKYRIIRTQYESIHIMSVIDLVVKPLFHILKMFNSLELINSISISYF